MTNKVREFGVDNADNYWKEREQKGRTSRKRVHYFIKELVDDVVNLSSSANVLICGVGDGHEYSLCDMDYITWGVEMSEYAISQYEFDTERIVQENLNNGIPAFNVKFNSIVVSMVLHWLDEPDSFLEKLQLHLSEDGKLVIVIPNITHYRYRVGFLAGKFPPISPSHKNFQTPIEVEEMFQRAGLTIEKKAPVKNSIKARLWPGLFATEIGYILKPTITL